MPKRKVTPFARFLLAMIIIVPLAFAGASYINGEDPISNFEQMTGIELNSDSQAAPKKPKEKASAEPAKTVAADTEALQQEIEQLRKELQQRDQAIEDLRQQLKECQ